MKQEFLPNAYVESRIVPFEDANISIATHALHYGTAAFGGMRAYPDKDTFVRFFRPDLHIKRLAQSAKLLGFPISEQQIRSSIVAFVNANPTDTAYYMRPLVYASDMGIAPRLHDIESDLLIYGVRMGQYLSADGISCCFSSWARGEDRALPLRGKISGNYVSSALAKTEAVERGFDEAIFLNSRGKIAEGSAMNIFIVREGVLVTPSISADILEGITRRSIIEIAQEIGVDVQEREIDKSELLIADEVFLTGTAAQIAPVGKIEQYVLSENKPFTTRLQKKMQDIISDSNHPWMQQIID